MEDGQEGSEARLRCVFRESSLVKNARGPGDEERQVGAVVGVCTEKGRG